MSATVNARRRAVGKRDRMIGGHKAGPARLKLRTAGRPVSSATISPETRRSRPHQQGHGRGLPFGTGGRAAVADDIAEAALLHAPAGLLHGAHEEPKRAVAEQRPQPRQHRVHVATAVCRAGRESSRSVPRPASASMIAQPRRELQARLLVHRTEGGGSTGSSPPRWPHDARPRWPAPVPPARHPSRAGNAVAVPVAERRQGELGRLDLIEAHRGITAAMSLAARSIAVQLTFRTCGACPDRREGCFQHFWRAFSTSTMRARVRHAAAPKPRR